MSWDASHHVILYCLLLTMLCTSCCCVQSDWLPIWQPRRGSPDSSHYNHNCQLHDSDVSHSTMSISRGWLEALSTGNMSTLLLEVVGMWDVTRLWLNIGTAQGMEGCTQCSFTNNLNAVVTILMLSHVSLYCTCDYPAASHFPTNGNANSLPAGPCKWIVSHNIYFFASPRSQNCCETDAGI